MRFHSSLDIGRDAGIQRSIIAFKQIHKPLFFSHAEQKRTAFKDLSGKYGKAHQNLLKHQKHTNAMSTETDRAQVEKHYKDPCVRENELPSYAVPGITYYEGYEKSRGAEDPLIPDYWVVVNGTAFKADNVQAIFSELNYVPTSEKDALNAAKTMVYLTYRNAVFADGITNNLPQAAAKQLTKPHVTHEGNDYRIHLIAYVEDRGATYRRAGKDFREGQEYVIIHADAVFSNHTRAFTSGVLESPRSGPTR